jgi:hypothetical protein
MSKILYPVHRTQNTRGTPSLRCPRCDIRKANTLRRDKLCGNCAFFADKKKTTKKGEKT